MVVIKYPLSSKEYTVLLAGFYEENLASRIDVTGQNYIQFKIFGSCVICAPLGRHIGRRVSQYIDQHTKRYLFDILTDITWSTGQPSVDRLIGQVSINILR